MLRKEAVKMIETKVFEERPFEACPLTCCVVPMGEDYTVTVYGGTLPHIGSTVMAQARPSLTGQGIGATSSVLNCVGHKDEAIARMFAERIAIHGNCTAVCACGIHLDSITEEQLAAIQAGCHRLLECVLAEIN